MTLAYREDCFEIAAHHRREDGIRIQLVIPGKLPIQRFRQCGALDPGGNLRQTERNTRGAFHDAIRDDS